MKKIGNDPNRYVDEMPDGIIATKFSTDTEQPTRADLSAL